MSAINAALETLRRSDVELARMPLLRVERGVWRFNTYVPSDHHSTVLLEGFAAPAAACGWMAYENVQLAQNRYDTAMKLLATGESPRNESLDASQLASWTLITHLLLNLSETVTKG